MMFAVYPRNQRQPEETNPAEKTSPGVRPSPFIGSMQDAHLVQHTVSFEDRPWLNDMDKKSPIEIAAEARRAASNNQARTPTLSL